MTPWHEKCTFHQPCFWVEIWAKLQSPCLHLQPVRNIKGQDFASSRRTIGPFLPRVWLVPAACLQSLLASLRCSLGWYMEGCCTPRFMDHDPETVETASFIFWMALELIGVKLAWKWSKQFLPSSLCFPLKFISVFCQNNGNRVSLTPSLTIA